MAITLIQTPNTNTPAFNDQWFTATSNQTAQPNFQFYVTIIVHYHNGLIYTTSPTFVESINTPPDGIMRFNARSYGENYIKNFVAITQASWSQCLNGVLKIVVNVGERYGSPVAIFPGANTTFHVWNASLGFTDFGAAYNAVNYVADNGSTFPILNDYPDTRTSVYSQNRLYIYCASDNVIQKARVTSNDGADIPVFASFDIANPFLASGNWYDRYICLNVSPSRLAVLGGVNWLGVPGTTYTIQLYDNAGILRKVINYDYSHVCSKFFKYHQLYLNSKGAFDHCFFEMVSEENYSIERTKVKHTPYYDPAATGAMTYQPSQATSFTYSTSYNKSLIVQTNWITETQSELLRDLVNSPVVYIQEAQGSAVIIFAANNTDSKYARKRHFNGKLFNLLVNLDMAFTSYRQKGV
jgi:hypothetical protein